jgi:hypothetical protein
MLLMGKSTISMAMASIAFSMFTRPGITSDRQEAVQLFTGCGHGDVDVDVLTFASTLKAVRRNGGATWHLQLSLMEPW